MKFLNRDECQNRQQQASLVEVLQWQDKCSSLAIVVSACVTESKQKIDPVERDEEFKQTLRDD